MRKFFCVLPVKIPCSVLPLALKVVHHFHPPTLYFFLKEAKQANVARPKASLSMNSVNDGWAPTCEKGSTAFCKLLSGNMCPTAKTTVFKDTSNSDKTESHHRNSLLISFFSTLVSV